MNHEVEGRRTHFMGSIVTFHSVYVNMFKYTDLELICPFSEWCSIAVLGACGRIDNAERR